MGLRSGERKERRFGEEEVGEIEGLELLEKWKEDEKQRKRLEKGLPADIGEDESEEAEGEEDGADGWEVEEDEDSDDSGGWIDVQSDVEIELSDEDEKPAAKKTKLEYSDVMVDDKENQAEKQAELEKKISTLATTRILTPADLAKLQELRLEASVNKHLPASQRKRIAQLQAQQNRHMDDPLTAAEIEGLASLSKKVSKADKVALARDGKVDRSEHKSTQAIRKEKKESEGKSTTNREKARKKNFMMTLGKAKFKQKHSLRERGRVLKAHIERSKRGGKRGNIGH